MTKTIQEMLTEIVQRMVEGGWNPLNKNKKYYQVRAMVGMHALVSGSDAGGFSTKTLSFPDLLLNAKAMGAVFDISGIRCRHWDRGSCEKVKDGCDGYDLCSPEDFIPTYISMQATRIALEKGIETAIEYVYKEMEKAK